MFLLKWLAKRRQKAQEKGMQAFRENMQDFAQEVGFKNYSDEQHQLYMDLLKQRGMKVRSIPVIIDEEMEDCKGVTFDLNMAHDTWGTSVKNKERLQEKFDTKVKDSAMKILEYLGVLSEVCDKNNQTNLGVKYGYIRAKAYPMLEVYSHKKYPPGFSGHVSKIPHISKDFSLN